MNYHHNFSVHNGERTYYPGIPSFIQVAEHYFVEQKVIDVWISLMSTSWLVELLFQEHTFLILSE